MARRARQGLSAELVRVSSEAIAGRILQSVDWAAVRSVHTYLSFASEREVDSKKLLETIWSLYPHIKTATWSYGRGELRSIWINSEGYLDIVDEHTLFDLIIVPVVAFDEECNRIGFGAGFYDRFLVTQPNAHTIGLAYDLSLCSFKREQHDIALDSIVTETRVYTFLKNPILNPDQCN